MEIKKGNLYDIVTHEDNVTLEVCGSSNWDGYKGLELE